MILVFLALLFSLFTFLLHYALNYTPHEQRFYKTQAKYIKSNWKKIIKNESEAFVEVIDVSKLIEENKALL